MPRLEFLIGGVQKGGTSALAQYLGAHPDVRLPDGKEAHIFDRPQLDPAWTAERFDAEYDIYFPALDPAAMCGDATPFYVFHPLVVARIARYNPAIKWIVLLRDPVDRAISHYHMERDRGFERLPLWAALLLEPWRLRGRRNDLSDNSPLRHHSYRTRGAYAEQLDTLHALFPPEQILILRSVDLLAAPGLSMQRVYAFLGLSAPREPADFMPVFSRPEQPRHRWLRAVLRMSFRRQLAKLRRKYSVAFDN